MNENLENAIIKYQGYAAASFVTNLLFTALIVAFGFIPMSEILFSIYLPFWATFFTLLGINSLLMRVSGAWGMIREKTARSMIENELKARR